MGMTVRPPSRPRVSVGLAVYNGEVFLEETMTSLLNQTYSDFELIVSDNASTDGTRDIVHRLQRDDPRIRLHVFPSNQGPAANYNKTVDLATGEYFAWSAADDVRATTFLERCVDVLDRDPGTVLAYSRTRIIEDGRSPRDYDYEPDVDAESPHDRLRSLLRVDHRRHGAFEIFGLMRLDALRDAGPLGAYARADSVMLARMALRGRFTMVPEHLFFNRNHPSRSVRSTPNRTYRERGTVVRVLGCGPIPADEWWDASKKGQVVWPEWSLLHHYRSAVANAPLDDLERSACRTVLADYAARHVPKLARDVLINAEFSLRRLTDRDRKKHSISTS
jgi:glycosyltransferase involved in cell wall biosynthesis